MSPTYEVLGGREGEIAETFPKYNTIEGVWVGMYGVPHKWATGGVDSLDSEEEAVTWLKSVGVQIGRKISDKPEKLSEQVL